MNITGYCCQLSKLFVTIAVKWINFFWCSKGIALCKRPFALNRQQPKKLQAKCRRLPPGNVSADDYRTGVGAILMKVFRSLLYAVLRNFSKLRLIKAFHRSTMTDERLTNMAMISAESDTAKIVRYD